MRGEVLGMKVGSMTQHGVFKVFTVSTQHYTCTMIPFELYSLRRASEKWVSNLCGREDEEMMVTTQLN